MKIAVIVPTLNRIDFIKRLLKYYEQFGKNLKIYIGDSSSKNSLSDFRNLNFSTNYEYFHIPGQNDREAILFLSRQVKEEFVAFSGDDDFLIASSLIKCAKFLLNHKDFRTAQGRAFVFTLKNNNLYEEIISLFPYWNKNSNEKHKASERALQFSKKYFVCYFSVHRRNEFVNDCEKIIFFKNRQLGEYAHCFTSITNGKSKYIDCLHMLRQHHPKRGESDVSVAVEQTESFWYKNTKFHNLERFQSLLFSNILNNEDKTNVELIKIKTKIIENLTKRIKVNKYLLIKKKIAQYFSFFLKILTLQNINNIDYSFYIKKNDRNLIKNFYKFILKD